MRSTDCQTGQTQEVIAQAHGPEEGMFQHPTCVSSTCTHTYSQRDALATSFRCVFCNHETSVSVKIDKKAGVGNLTCKSCGQSFQTSINCTCWQSPIGLLECRLTVFKQRSHTTCRCLLRLDRRLRRRCERSSLSGRGRCSSSCSSATCEWRTARRSGTRREIHC